jgi:hypothetical protein
MDRRNIDAAIILYGNDSVKRTELLAAYDVSYFYWHDLWFTLDYVVQDGAIIAHNDALLVFDDPAKRAELARYNVSYQPTYGYVDPALRGERFQQFDLLVIFPHRFDRMPFADDFTARLTPVLLASDNSSMLFSVGVAP